MYEKLLVLLQPRSASVEEHRFVFKPLGLVCYYGSETEGSLSYKKAFFLMSEQFELDLVTESTISRWLISIGT